MRTVPRAPFSEQYFSTGNNVAIEKPKARPAEEIVDEALADMLPRVEESKYDGIVHVKLPIKMDDPDIVDIRKSLDNAVDGKGYGAAVRIIGNEYFFTLSWETPFDHLFDVLADDKYSDVHRFCEIGTLIYMHDPHFEKVQEGLWKLDLSGCGDGTQRPLDPLALSRYVLEHYGWHIFYLKDTLYVFSDEKLNEPKKGH